MKNLLGSEKFGLVLATVIFGTIGLFRRFIPLSSSIIALVRGTLGAVFLLVIYLLRKKKGAPKSDFKGNFWVLLISGACIGANWILLFEAYNYTSVSVATVSYYMAPVFVVLASPIVVKEHLTIKKCLCALAAFVGLIFVSGVFETGLTGIRGVVLGLMAAVLYSAVVLLNKFIKNMQSIDRTLCQLVAAAVTLLPYVLLTEDLTDFPVDARSIILLIFVGVIHTGLAYTLYFRGIGKVSVQTAAIFSYIDPIVAVILSVTVLHEPMSLLSAIGIVLVIGSTIYSELGRE